MKIVTLQNFQVGEALFRTILVDPYEFDDFYNEKYHGDVDAQTFEKYRDVIEIPIKVVDRDRKSQAPL